MQDRRVGRVLVPSFAAARFVVRRARTSPAWAITIAAFTALACGSDTPAEPGSGQNQPVRVTITPSEARLEALQDTVRFTATAQNALATATVAWTSLDASVATVVNGLVTAVANGSTRIVAAVAGAADTAMITVSQVGATISLTPASDSMPIGATRQLSAAVRDRNNVAIGNASVTWSSADPTIATVNTAGVVAGVSAGLTTIEARSGVAVARATVTVVLAPLIIARDTALKGTIVSAGISIPRGVTVIASGDMKFDTRGPVVIAGTLAGDCVDISVNARDSLSVTGVVRNTCGDQSHAGKPLRLNVDGLISMTGARVESSGEIEITNAPAATFRAGLPLSAYAAAGEALADCTFRSTTIGQPGHAPAGVAGSPDGTRGSDGDKREIRCLEDLTFISSKLIGEGGGPGGNGTATAGAPGHGGDGGRGGDVWLLGRGDALFGGGSLVFAPAGGRGGDADGGPVSRAEAIGGNAGDSGLPLFSFSTNATLTVEPSGLDLVVNGIYLDDDVGKMKRGGHATATGKKGADATPSAPAQPGDSAMATGGKGGSVRHRTSKATLPTIKLLGGFDEAIFEAGLPVNPANVNLVVEDAGVGGLAYVRPGDGGNGIRSRPTGAPGGNFFGYGGEGGSSLIIDNRQGSTPVGKPADGGSVTLVDGNGGLGWNGCVQPFQPGGQSGDGGIASGFTGAPGLNAAAVPANRGDVKFQRAGNGAYGHDGAGPANGGRAGTFAFSLFGRKLDDGQSFTKGLRGVGCELAMNNTSVDVDKDPGGHAPFDRGFKGTGKRTRLKVNEGNGQGESTMPSAPMTLHATASATTIYKVAIEGDAPWQTLNGTLADNDSLHARSLGTFAGFSNVEFVLDGKMLRSASGDYIGFDALITVGGRGELPRGQAITYRITARPAASPSSVDNR